MQRTWGWYSLILLRQSFPFNMTCTKTSPKGETLKTLLCVYRVFSHDVTAAILVSQNNETAAMLVTQTNPMGDELFSCAKAFFSSNKFA